MDTTQVTYGALLHDLGKAIFRAGSELDGRAHSTSGTDFLAGLDALRDKTEILNCVRFHHAKELKGANIPVDSIAYIVYAADNVAAGADRREKETDSPQTRIFEKFTPQQSVFNLLNQNRQSYGYNLAKADALNLPKPLADITPAGYDTIVRGLREGLIGLVFEKEYINSLLELLEAHLSYVPSSTDQTQTGDISLFDHAKITAAVAACMLLYLKEIGCVNYKTELFENEPAFRQKNSMLMVSCDVSGIQSFIYTIASKNALKSLRSRSFYLEIMMESFIDDLLHSAGLSRANLIYAGGGHCYLLLPNTRQAKNAVASAQTAFNKWLLDRFKTGLFVAVSTAECSCADLMNSDKNKNATPLSNVYRTLSQGVSQNKLCRYTAGDIIRLNTPSPNGDGRECSVCHTVDRLTDANLCETCQSLIAVSNDLIRADTLFAVTGTQEKGKGTSVPMPSALMDESYLSVADEARARALSKAQTKEVLRLYGKNRMYTGLRYSTKLWVGTHHTEGREGIATFEELAARSKGIRRLAVMRADVDNLGSTFVSGFARPTDAENPHRYETLSRTAVLSRQLSLFFKKHINEILSGSAPCAYFSLTGEVPNKNKNVTIVYSGGDDVFLVGAWNEVIEAAVDLRMAFAGFTQNTLTFSAGIGLFEQSYPISRMAEETQRLLEAAKQSNSGAKNAVALFSAGENGFGEDNTYTWSDFTDNVIGQKLRLLQSYFKSRDGDKNEERAGSGNAFLYRLLELLRAAEDKINIARCAYLLARMEPHKNDTPEAKQAHKTLSENVYRWIASPQDRRQLITAIGIHVYLTRNTDNKEEAK